MIVDKINEIISLKEGKLVENFMSFNTQKRSG